MNDSSPCSVYVVHRHALFAQGVCSMLQGHGELEVVGLEDDLGRASLAVRELRPDVILVEESLDCSELWTFLEAAGTSRIVTVSINHTNATVYDRHRTVATSVADLIDAILGRVPLVPASIGHDEH